MKILSKLIFPMLLLALTLMTANESYAQCGTMVETATLDPNGTAEINHTVGSSVPCKPFTMVRLCVFTDAGSLCPGAIVWATVYDDNGNIVAQGNINQTGNYLEFEVLCGTPVQVVVGPPGPIQPECLPPTGFIFSLTQE